jgi:replicative DNA helicase
MDMVGKGPDAVGVGFNKVDLVRGECVVLAARPSMGKSQLAFQMAYNATKEGKRVFVASLEMSAKQAVARMVQPRAGYNIRNTDENAVVVLTSALTELMGSEQPRMVLFDGEITSTQLRSYCNKWAEKWGGLDLVVTDHLRFFKDRRSEERHRLGDITHNHVRIAREFDCAVLACAQLSRATEARENKRPGLSDLRDSGEIEENTDVAAFIHRPGYYDYRDGKVETQSGEAFVYTAKNRDGPLWKAKLWFDENKGPRFTEMQPEATAGYPLGTL